MDAIHYKICEDHQVVTKAAYVVIRSDMEAVKNAITYRYSNGLTEGHNNKIKMIKRQMYGRCKFDLLRLKILH